MNTRALLGMSHPPLLGLNPLPPDAERRSHDALAAMRSQVAAHAPEFVVLVAPDHYNGSFNELMPLLCVGTEASSVCNYKSIPGPLNVDATAALGLAKYLMDAGFDPAVCWMNAIGEGGRTLDDICDLTEESIERDAGLSGNGSKSWLVARSALPTDRALPCRLRHYQVTSEYIAGFRVMFLEQPQ